MIKLLVFICVISSLFVATIEPISGLLGLFFTLYIALKYYDKN